MPRRLSLDGLWSLGVRKEKRAFHSFIHGLDKDWLSTYYVQLTMPRA